MKRDRSLALPAAAAAVLLIAAGLVQPLAVGTSAVKTPSPEPSAPQNLATSIANCDLEAAAELLSNEGYADTGLATDEAFPPPALILGLAAERCAQHSKGLAALRAQGPGGAFADWHLLALARSAIELGQYPVASDSLDRFLSEHPDSPLFEQALLAASRLADKRGDLAGVAAAAHQGRSRQVSRTVSEALEIAAWHAGTGLEDASIRRTAAVQLLSEHPLRAADLEVVEEFRETDGAVEWTEFMSPEQMVQRAESLLEAGLGDSAALSLADVRESDRTWHWYSTSARTLTASGRGEEALALLETMPIATREQSIEREWRSAWAALEVSSARSGRALTADQRRMMRDRAHAHLESALSLGLDRERTRRALRVLFEDALEDDRFERAVENLRRLKALDPNDTTGARKLWQLGWKQHNQKNYSGAIGYWSELSDLYPTSSYNRSGLYWSARAHEALGNPSRARVLLREVADVSFTDFYRRHALLRLGSGEADQQEPAKPTEPWPRHPALARAEVLHSLGLREAALVEVEAIGASIETRPVRALRSLILAAAGERRKSIIEIKGVYPLLGTPFQDMTPERARRLYYPLAYDEIIAHNSELHDLDRNLVLAMIRQESAFDPSALSWAGARGLMQVMPATGREIARRLGLKYTRERGNDPGFSIQLGTAYYRQVRSMFGDDDELSLAGYNAGPYRIKRLWRQAGSDAEMDRFLETLDLEETRWYVKRVLLFADSYSRLYADAG